MKKALIIGGAGFVGKHLAEHIHKEYGWSLDVTKMQCEQLNLSHAEIHDIDILKMEQIETLICRIRPDYIFHLAAQSSVSLSWTNPQFTVDVNIKGSLNLLESVRTLDYKPRILLIGSSEEYGRIKEYEQQPISEETLLNPGNIYAVTKVCQNMIGKLYTEAYGLDIISVRAFNHIGPGQSETFVVADFCKQVAQIELGEKEPILSVGNLSAKRDFTDVRDIVKCYCLLMIKGRSGETYNVGSGQAWSIQELLDVIIASSINHHIEVHIDEQKFRPIEVPVIKADLQKLEADTDWKPESNIEKTIEDTLMYWRQKLVERRK